MKHILDIITVRCSKKFQYFYAGDFLIHKLSTNTAGGEKAYVDNNRLCIVGRDGKIRTFPLKKDVLYELTKLQRRVLFEKFKHSEI